MLWLAGLMGLMTVGAVSFVDMSGQDDDAQGDAPQPEKLADDAPRIGDDFNLNANDPVGFRDASIIVGNDDAETLTGTGDDDDDQIGGYDGEDTIHGGDGDDDIHSMDGDDALSGDAGDDTLHGGERQ